MNSPVATPPTRCCTLAVACDFHAIREAAGQVRQFLTAAGLPASEGDAWELILTEAGNNAVQHATATGRHLPIGLDVVCGPTGVELRMTDHTAGFVLPAVAALPAADSEHGRGLYLIQTLADSVDYLQGRAENCLVVRKKIAAPLASPTRDLAGQLAESEQTLQAMTEELASCYENLSAVFRFSAALNQPQAAEEFAAKWLGELLTIVEADWYVLRVAEAGAVGELRVFASSFHDGLERMTKLLLRTAGMTQVEVAATLTKQDEWFDAQTPLESADLLAALVRRSSGLAHPIFVNETLLGMLTVGRLTDETPFKAAQVNIIQTFADFLGIQIANDQFRSEYLRTQLLRRELEIASDLQRSLLPETLPQLPGFGLAGQFQSARQVGGDFYDAIPIAGGRLLLAIADVMGKGVPAALFAAIFRSHLRARLYLADRPGDFLSWLNRSLFPDLNRLSMFITAQLVIIDPAARQVRVAGAGHCPLLVTTPGGTPREIPNTGLPLGIEAEVEYAAVTQPLKATERLLLFTDGLSDVRGAGNQILGLDRLKQHLQRITNQSHTAVEMAQALTAVLKDFQGDQPPADDQAFLVFAGE